MPTISDLYAAYKFAEEKYYKFLDVPEKESSEERNVREERRAYYLNLKRHTDKMIDQEILNQIK